MRKSIILIMLIVLSIQIRSQERVNRVLPKISQVTSQLTNAKGWRFQDDGQWEGSNKKIPIDSGDYLIMDKSIGSDNFSYIQFRNIDYNGLKYVLILKKTRSGKNKFRYNYAIFNDEIFSEFDELKDGQINYIRLNPLLLSFIDGNDETIISKIKSEISIEGLNGEDCQFVFRISPYKEKGVVQFLFYDDSSFEYHSSYGLIFFMFPIMGNGEIDKIYYEASYIDFDKLIKLKE